MLSFEFADFDDFDRIATRGGHGDATLPLKPTRDKKTKENPGEMPLSNPSTHKNFTLPLTGGEVATIQLPHPMSEVDYNILTAVLGAMKAALTAPANESAKPKGKAVNLHPATFTKDDGAKD